MSNEVRFKMPNYEELIGFAILFNDGKIDMDKLSDMVAMTQMILDRLHEHGDINIKSSVEKRIEDSDKQQKP